VQWASLPREHYCQLYLDVLTTLAKEYEIRGDLSEAAEMLRQTLEKESTLETAHRGLMRVFAKKGQATRALHQYEVCREVIGKELGVDPSTETTKTRDEMREGQLGKDEQQDGRRTSISGTLPPSIGRAEERSGLVHLL